MEGNNMKNKKQRPELFEQLRDVKNLISHNKYTKLSPREQKVYDLLKQNKKTVIELTMELYLADPRGYIRSLRKKGVTIMDEWVKGKDTHFKRYWIEPHKSELL